MLDQYLQQNPNEAEQYYGKSHGGLGFNQIKKYLQLVNWKVAQENGYASEAAIQWALEQRGGLQRLQQLGIIPQQPQKQPQPPQQAVVDPNIPV